MNTQREQTGYIQELTNVSERYAKYVTALRQEIIGGVLSTILL